MQETNAPEIKSKEIINPISRETPSTSTTFTFPIVKNVKTSPTGKVGEDSGRGLSGTARTSRLCPARLLRGLGPAWLPPGPLLPFSLLTHVPLSTPHFPLCLVTPTIAATPTWSPACDPGQRLDHRGQRRRCARVPDADTLSACHSEVCEVEYTEILCAELFMIFTDMEMPQCPTIGT